MPHQSRNILCTLPQRGDLDWKYFQTIAKDFSKCPLVGHRPQSQCVAAVSVATLWLLRVAEENGTHHGSILVAISSAGIRLGA